MRHITGVDHVALMVRDLDEAADRWRRFGFALSPRQVHSEHIGSANHTFVLGDCYVELMGFVAETEFNRPWLDRLAAREGAYLIMLGTTDVRGALADLRSAGIETSDLVQHGRPATLPDGRVVQTAFEITLVTEDESPGAHIGVCGHLTPEYVFLPELRRHANGATHLSGITIATTEPRRDARTLARFFGTEPRDEGLDSMVETGNVPIRLATPMMIDSAVAPSITSASPLIAEVTVTVNDIDQTRAVFTAGGVPFTGGPNECVIAATEANGVALRLRAAGEGA